MRKEKVLEHFDLEWRAFLHSFEGLPDELLTRPYTIGKWSIRDLLTHITTWEEEALKAVPLILAGNRLPRYSRYGGIDAFNAREQSKKQDLPIKQVKSDLYAVHQKLISCLLEIPEADYIGIKRLSHRVRLDTYAHYRIHAADLNNRLLLASQSAAGDSQNNHK
jgi:hypothetical protein